MWKHNTLYMTYADDYQAYTIIKPKHEWSSLVATLEACLPDIRAWMCANQLKLNHHKTELIVFRPHHRVFAPQDCTIQVHDACRTLVQAIIAPCLDYANILLYALMSSLLSKLQRVQNCAATY